MVDRPARRLVACFLVLLVSASAVLAAQTVHAQRETIYVNVNQNAVLPGSDISAYVYGTPDRVELRRIDPLQYVREASSAIANGSILETRTLAPTPFQTYKSETFTFASVPAGLLAVAAIRDGAIVRADLVQSSRIGVVARHGATQDLYWVVRVDTGEPVPGASVHRGGVFEGLTDSDGLLRASRLARPALAISGEDVAMDSGGWSTQDEAGRIAVTSDRPLYRPGQTAHLKLVSWGRDGDRFVGAANESVLVKVTTWTRSKMETVASATLTTNAFGSASLDVALPGDAAIGSYTVQATSGARAGYGSIQVEAYRLPKFRVEASPNEGKVVVGETREILVAAKTYYGEAVTRGTVEYSVRIGSFYDCWYRCWYGYYGGYGGVSERGEMELAGDGTARLRVTPESPGRYQVQVKVTGITGEVIETFADFEAHPSSLVLRAEPEGYVVRTGEPSRVSLILEDLRGHPANGTVEVVLRDRSYVNGTQSDHLVDARSVPVRGGSGLWSYTFHTAGYYSLVATAVDAAGRATTSERWLYVGSANHGWYTSRGLEVLVESEDVALGAVIRAHVISTRPQPVLMVLEGADPTDARLIRSGAAPFAVVAAERHAPNVNVVALQVVPAPGTYTVANLQQDTARVRVSPHPRSLNVTIETDKDRYSDGDRSRILITVRDAGGRPVAAEVSLAMIDQALLDLSGRDVAEFFRTFYPDRSGLSGTTSWGNGGPVYRMAGGGAGLVEEAHDAMRISATTTASSPPPSPPASLQVREYFPETALREPHLRTGPDGRLRIEALLPDSLTTWHLRAEAITAQGQTGSGETSILTSRTTVADLFGPRFLTQGDEATVQATFANYAGVFQDFRVLLNATGASVVGADHRTVTLGHGQTELVSFRIRATEPGTAVLTLYGWSGAPLDVGDAVRIRLPVRPHGVETLEASAGVNEAHVTIAIPPDAVGRASRLNVTLSPTVADALVEALPYLVGFPYGCVEQTLSKFLPDLAVVQAAKAFGLNQSKIDPKLDEHVESGLARLYGFQHQSGAWGWWESDPDNPYTTAYVVYGLSLAKQAGYAIDESIRSRGIEALAKMEGLSPALAAYRSYALAVADPGRANAIPSGTSPAQLALGALAAKLTGQDALAAQKVAALRAAAIQDASGTHWRESINEWGDHGVSTDTMLTALALRALLRVAPESEETHGAARWLLNNREGASWSTTKDTAESVLSLVAYFERVGAESKGLDVNVRIDGRDHPIRFEAGKLLQAGRGIEIPVEPGIHTVDITKRGDNVLYWSVAARFWKSAEPLRASSGPFRFLQEVLDEGRNPVTTLTAGDEATLRLRFENVGEARRYVQIESALPAGVEVIKDTAGRQSWWRGSDCYWCGGWSAAEVRDDRVGFFAWRMESGESYTYEVRIRALFPGTYHVLPPSAEEMYDPLVRGHGDEMRLTIVDRPALQLGRIEVGPGRVRANVYGVGALPSGLTAWTSQDRHETPRGTFLRGDDGAWAIDVTAPAGGYDLWLQAGTVVLTRRIDLSSVSVAPVVRFNASAETTWTLGPVTELVSGVALAKSRPDFSAAFGGVDLDPIGAPVRGASEAPTTAGPVVLAAIAATVALVRLSARRRRES